MKLDTAPIAAIATASGRGGVGIVRISGKNLDDFIMDFFKGSRISLPMKPRFAYFVPFNDAEGNKIDEGLALFFKGPHSYSGEDTLELQGHGGTIVMQMLLKRCLEAGAGIGMRLAEPGEFTRRAFLNNRIDLTQAEAIADLIDATTEEAVRSATRSMSGEFSRQIQSVASEVANLRMLIEATMDFPEEDTDFLAKEKPAERIEGLLASLDHILGQAAQGVLLRDGIHVVLAGQTNVGKSSLFNSMTGTNTAIVTPIAGTTRDKITESLQLEGVPITLTDTAGIREASEADEVEKIGIGRTWDEIGKADIILHLLDASIGPTREDEQTFASFPENIPVIQVWNKIDLSGHKPSLDHIMGTTQVYLSTVTGEGLDLLRKAVLEAAGWVKTGESTCLARERHLTAIRDAGNHLTIAVEQAKNGEALELLAEELRLAQNALNSITGEFTSDDLLGKIFSQFCIGK